MKLNQLQTQSRILLDEIETNYYEEVDQLFVQLDEITDVKGLKLEFFDFQFMQDWHAGTIDSEQVLNTLEKIEFRDAARNKLTRRLVAYMIHKEHLSDYIKPVIARVLEKCLEDMIIYLTTLQRLFEEYTDIDSDQVPVTWVEHTMGKNGEIAEIIYELPLNQIIRQINGEIYPNLQKVFYYSENVILLDEVKEDKRILNWFFAPKSYIDLLRKEYDITEKLVSQEEQQFLKTILEKVS